MKLNITSLPEVGVYGIYWTHTYHIPKLLLPPSPLEVGLPPPLRWLSGRYLANLPSRGKLGVSLPLFFTHGGVCVSLCSFLLFLWCGCFYSKPLLFWGWWRFSAKPSKFNLVMMAFLYQAFQIWWWRRFYAKSSKSGDDGVSMPRLPNLAMMAFLCQALKNMVMMAFLCQVFKIDDDGECFYAKSFKSGYDGVSLPSLPDLVNWTFLCLPSSPLVMWAFLCLPSSLPRCGRFSAPTPSPLWCGRFSSAPSPSSSFLLFSPAADF